MEVLARIIKLKPDSGPKVEDWAQTLNSRRAEAIQTIRDEGIEIESWFSFAIEGENYLLCYVRSESLERAKQVYEQSPHAIDEYHQNFKDEVFLRDQINDARLLVDLTTED